MSNYKLLWDTKINNEIPIKKYVFEKSSIKVYIAEIVSPIVQSYKFVATEENSDDGCPHALEHLVFLGSEEYPYKGVLDLLANRSLASGTNASTETTCTTYKLNCVGSEGLLHMLPIYLDHIFFPTLTSSSFLTEIYSITKDGKESGTVYCEMQGKEHNGRQMCFFEMMRNIYPGNGYSMNTGGALKNIRENLTIEKIRDYHQQFYRSENFSILICGQVEIEDVAKAVEKFERKICSKNYGPYVKPWQNIPQPLLKSKEVRVDYPSEDEEVGMVLIGFQMPIELKSLENIIGTSVLLKYLTLPIISPLSKAFIEIDDPLASNISADLTEYSVPLISFSFEDISIESIEIINEKLKNILEDIVDEKIEFNIDLLNVVFEKYIVEELSSVESSPSDYVAKFIKMDMLENLSFEDFQKRVNVLEIIENLKLRDSKFWINMLKALFIDNPSVTVKGYPSVNEKVNLDKSEKERLEDLKEKLGIEGLIQKGKELEAAIGENNQEPPMSLLTLFPVPSIENIKFHEYEIMDNTSLNLDHNLPFNLKVYNIATNFSYVTAAFDTTPIPLHLRPYLLLFFEMILESPVQVDSTLVPIDEVINIIEDEIIWYDTQFGFFANNRYICGPFSSIASFYMQAEVRKLPNAVKWMSHLIFDSVFTSERIKNVALKCLSEISSEKSDEMQLVRQISRTMHYPDGTNVKELSLLRQSRFMTEILKKLKSDVGAENVIGKLNFLRKILSQNLTVHVVVDVNKFSDFKGLISCMIDKFDTPYNHLPSPITFDYNLIHENGVFDTKYSGMITGIGFGSSYLIQTSPGIKGFNHPDQPILDLFLTYLTQQEGPIYKKIRSSAYSSGIVSNPSEGQIILTFLKSNDLYRAFKDTKDIIEAHTDENFKFDEIMLDAAKSSMIFNYVNSEKSIGGLAQLLVTKFLKGSRKDCNKELLKRILTISQQELKEVGKKYLRNMFDTKSSKISIVCQSEKLQELSDLFQEFGHNLKVCKKLEDSVLN